MHSARFWLQYVLMKKHPLPNGPRTAARKLELRREKVRDLGTESLEQVRGGCEQDPSYRACVTGATTQI